jgi:hypothetical protein
VIFDATRQAFCGLYGAWLTWKVRKAYPWSIESGLVQAPTPELDRGLFLLCQCLYLGLRSSSLSVSWVSAAHRMVLA